MADARPSLWFTENNQVMSSRVRPPTSNKGLFPCLTFKPQYLKASHVFFHQSSGPTRCLTIEEATKMGLIEVEELGSDKVVIIRNSKVEVVMMPSEDLMK
jgi:hypothetical protein